LQKDQCAFGGHFFNMKGEVLQNGEDTFLRPSPLSVKHQASRLWTRRCASKNFERVAEPVRGEAKGTVIKVGGGRL